MLQNLPADLQLAYQGEDQGLDPSYFFDIVKKRKFYILIPFIVVFAIGFAVAMLWPPTFLSEAKILVESQQIPTELVRPTVTATAKERIMVIQQRVLTRDNLLAIVDKYQLFADQRDKLSRTELLDLMRDSTVIKPVELDPQKRRNENVTIAVTLGFTHRKPDVATKVANELVTLFLNEDARNRTNRAMETTKFLGREVQKLEADLAAVDVKIIEVRRQQRANAVAEPAAAQMPQLATLRAELAAKSTVYSNSHPEMKRLKALIQALEKEPGPIAPPRPMARADVADDALDPLWLQRISIQKNLESASQKLSAARLGETLERDQFSERLEVLEQAVPPQKPIKPNRPMFIALAFAAAIMAGFGAVFAVETFDRTIRGTRDLLTVASGHAIVAIPYLATRAELVRKKSKIILVTGLLLVGLLAGVAAIHLLLRPLDELWVIFVSRLLGAWTGF